MMLGCKSSDFSLTGLISSASTQSTSAQLSFTWGTGSDKPRSGDVAVVITTWTDTGTASSSISWAGGLSLGGFVSDDANATGYPGHRVDQKVCTGSESGSFSSAGLPTGGSPAAAVYLLFRGVSVPSYARRSTQTSSTLDPSVVTDTSQYTQSGDYVLGVGLHFLDISNTSTPTVTSQLKEYIEAGQTGASMAVAVWAPSNTGADTAYNPDAFGVSGFTSQFNSTLTIPLLAP